MADEEQQQPNESMTEPTTSNTGEVTAEQAANENAPGSNIDANPAASSTDANVAEQQPTSNTESAGMSDTTSAVSSPIAIPTDATQQDQSAMPVPVSQSGEEEKKKSDTKLKKKSSTSRKRGNKSIDLQTAKIGILGAGKMCEALVDGLINFAKISANRIHVASPSLRNSDRFKQLGCVTTKRNIDIFARYDCEIIFLAFHGGVVKYCYKLGGSRPHPITTNYIPNMKHPICILSMVSGVNLDQIKAVLLNPEHPKQYQLEIHRIMLNAACAYGLGVCAIDVEPDSSQLSAPIRTLLSTIGRLEHVPQSQMDAACAIGGNGLAFGYYLMNAMADGAFKMGLSRNMAIKFAAKTVQCGAQCLLESGRHPSELKDAVTAAGGPAIYGLHVLDKADVASGIQTAVEAAYRRASELAETEIV